MRALLGFALALAGCIQREQSFHEPDPSLNRMMSQPRVDPLEVPMRKPPEGTVALASAPNESWDAARETGMVGGKIVEKFPMPITKELLERGRQRFEITCATCHGELGDGKSSAAVNMPLRKPRSLLDDEVRAKKPGDIFIIISRGFGFMPPLAWQIERDDRWAIAAYLRALQLSQRAEIAKLPPDVRQKVEALP